MRLQVSVYWHSLQSADLAEALVAASLLCCVVLCHAVVCCAVVCCAVLYYVTIAFTCVTSNQALRFEHNLCQAHSDPMPCFKHVMSSCDAANCRGGKWAGISEQFGAVGNSLGGSVQQPGCVCIAVQCLKLCWAPLAWVSTHSSCCHLCCGLAHTVIHKLYSANHDSICIFMFASLPSWSSAPRVSRPVPYLESASPSFVLNPLINTQLSSSLVPIAPIVVAATIVFQGSRLHALHWFHNSVIFT